MAQKLRLISRWQNSAGERVRIALNLKQINYEYVPINSLSHEDYLKLNPQGLLPTLEIDGQCIAQSSAILEYLEELFPDQPLLPTTPLARAQARAFASHIASDIHTITVKRVRKQLNGGAANR